MSHSPSKTFIVEHSTLNAVPAGLSLARSIIEALEDGRAVRLDLEFIERLTPSVANALVMTVLDAVDVVAFRARIQVKFGSVLVEEAWNKAVSRYERGVRLTTQRQGAA